MALVNPIELLERKDKWYLGNGGMLIYAPAFPSNLDIPGFWDECHWGDIAIQRLLCVSFVLQKDGSLVELNPIQQDWRWFPDRIEISYKLAFIQGIGTYRDTKYSVSEKRMISPDNTLICEIGITKEKETKSESAKGSEILHVVAWTVKQKARSDIPKKHSDFKHPGNSLKYSHECVARGHHKGNIPIGLDITMSSTPHADSYEVTPGHGANMVPSISYTPFWDSLQQGKLSGVINGDNVLGAVAWAGMHWKRDFKSSKPFNLRVEVNITEVETGKKKFTEKEKTDSHDKTIDPQVSWREFMANVPGFQSSDEMLTRYYWYRWYGIRLNAVPKGGNYVAPAVTEGIAYFRGVITYSLMCHLYECKWLADPSLAMGCLRNHIAHQSEKGHFPGHIYVNTVNKSGFYHTDVGRSARELLEHHPGIDLKRELYPPLKKLLDFYLKERDQEGIGLYDILDQFETGQEYTSRYFHGDSNADLYGWEHKIKLKGIDVTCYVYNLADLLEELAPVVGKKHEEKEYTNLKDKIRKSVREKMWDRSRGFFFDYSAISHTRSRYLTAVGFYPLMSDIATDDMALDAAKFLENEKKFLTEYPTPTVPVDDKYFSPDARWRKERTNCPWNGRVWPMVNSHMVEVIARLAEIEPGKYRPMLATYLSRFIEMMHYEKDNSRGAEKDMSRPNCFEHYNPIDGTASEYRGIDDYMHSWINDLILKYVTGVRVKGSKVTIDPFPFKLSNFLLTNLKIRGHKIDVCYKRERNGKESDGYRIYIDDVVEFKDKQIQPWEVAL